MRDVIHIRVNTAEEMGRLGRLFGATVLKPLVEQHAHTPSGSQVISLYGDVRSGKSTFARGALNFLPQVTRAINGYGGRDGLMPRVCQGWTCKDNDVLVRWMDFGLYTRLWSSSLSEHPDQYEIDNLYQKIPLRTEPLDEKPYAPGVDFFEHAPAYWHNSASIVVLIALAGDRLFNKPYFPAQRIESEAKINPTVAHEMSRMTRIENSALRWLWGEAASSITKHTARHVSLIATRADPALQSAFAAFKNEL